MVSQTVMSWYLNLPSLTTSVKVTESDPGLFFDLKVNCCGPSCSVLGKSLRVSCQG